MLMRREESNFCMSYLCDDVYSDWILSLDICECREEDEEEVEGSKKDDEDESLPSCCLGNNEAGNCEVGSEALDEFPNCGYKKKSRARFKRTDSSVLEL